jgi:tRNA pseudouridine38-40 synthase
MRSVGTEVRSTVRTVYYCEVKRTGDLVTLRVAADGFLYNMVRAITGTVVYAAEGKLSPEDVPAILDGRVRTAGGPTAPPGGLCLTRLWYPEPLGEQM